MKITTKQIRKMKKKKGTQIFHILHDERRCSVCGEVGSVKHFADKNFPTIYHKECEKCGTKLE